MKNPARAKKRPTRKNRHRMAFPQVKGKKLEAVEFWTSPENHAISLRFHDKTMLVFDIELGFSIFADYSDWKTGNYKPIKRWRPVRSRLFRE